MKISYVLTLNHLLRNSLPVKKLKLTSLFILTLAFGINPLFAEENSSPWHSFLGIQGGLYDSPDIGFAGIEGGLGYEVGPLVHYLFLGAGEVFRDSESTDSILGGLGGGSGSEEPDLGQLEIGYRLAFNLNNKISLFADLGFEYLQGEANVNDALGNNLQLDFESKHVFLGGGIQMNVWKGLNLEFSCRYLPGIEDSAFGNIQTDALGNSGISDGDTPNFLVKLGISYLY